MEKFVDLCAFKLVDFDFVDFDVPAFGIPEALKALHENAV
jgi:hypothetical protein